MKFPRRNSASNPVILSLSTFLFTALFFTAPFFTSTAWAQTETVLYTFTGGADGAYPNAVMRDAAGNLYGTTQAGGGSGCFNSEGCGTVFELSKDGNETILYKFTGKADGGSPYAGVVRDADGNLYGTASVGGRHRNGFCVRQGCGTVFEVTPTGEEILLHSFTGEKDGAFPGAGSLLRDAAGNLYGTTEQGGGTDCENGCGTIFEIRASGTEKVLWAFGSVPSDGNTPYTGLTQDSNGNFYGTTFYGGDHGAGAMYELSSSGTESVLYNFCPTLDCSGDGANPYAALVRDDDGNLYGTAYDGGAHAQGSVFEITSAGKFKMLHSFTGGEDGGHPYAGLVRDQQGNLYGTTYYGGLPGCNDEGCGTVFEITADGKLKVLYRFTGGTDGQWPFAGLVRDTDGNLYGTTNYGGYASCYNGFYYGCGVVFKITF